MCLILAAPIISNSTQSVHVVSKQRPQSYHPRHRFFGRWSAGVLCSFSTVAGWIPRVSCEAFWSFKGSDGFSTFDFGSRHDGHLQSVATQRRDADYLAVRFSNNRSQHGTAMYPGKETSAVQPCELATVPCALVQFDQTQTHIRKHSFPFDSNKSM